MTGYERLSRLIGTYPELAIYRKFSTLCTRLLLYKQAELQHLENELNIISQVDARDPRKSVYAVSWEALNGDSEISGDNLQRQKVMEIDEKMDKYCQPSTVIWDVARLTCRQTLLFSKLVKSTILRNQWNAT